MRPLGYGRQAVDTDQEFFDSTYRRLVVNMVGFGLAGMPAVWVWYGRAMALTFFLGSAIAIVNFFWLKSSVVAMGARLERTGQTPSSSGIILRFLLRYFLIALAAYAILKSTAGSLNGLFIGLSLPVGSILIEAVYQVLGAFRTRTLNPRN